MKKRLLNEFFIITISQAVLLSLVSWQRKKRLIFSVLQVQDTVHYIC